MYIHVVYWDSIYYILRGQEIIQALEAGGDWDGVANDDIEISEPSILRIGKRDMVMTGH